MNTELLSSIASVVNMSLQFDKFPAELKEALITRTSAEKDYSGCGRVEEFLPCRIYRLWGKQSAQQSISSNFTS